MLNLVISMPEGGVVDFSEVSQDLRLKSLTKPCPSSISLSEYHHLRTICSEVLGEIDGESIVKIQSNTRPIYRSSDAVQDADRDSKSINRPEIMTQFLQDTDNVDLSRDLGGTIFILINYSCFKPTWSIEYCRDLMMMWKKKIQDGLDEFVGGIGEKESSPSIEVKVYKDVNEIGRNPMKYFADVLNKRHASNVLNKQLPTVFIDCSPFSSHTEYEFDYFGELPEFTLCYSLTQNDNDLSDTDKVDAVVKNVGSGFTIFQKVSSDDSMKSIAEVLKIGAVLSAKMVIGSKHKNTKFFEHLSRGAFFESRKTVDSKSTSARLNRGYKSCSHFMPSGIKDLTSDWVDYNGSQVFSALKEYNRALLHCKYESDDLSIRRMSELRIKDWCKLTVNIANLGDDLKLKYSGDDGDAKWYRLVRRESNKQLVVELLDRIKGKLNNESEKNSAIEYYKKLKVFLAKIVEVNTELNITEMKEFYSYFSDMIFKLKDIYRISNKFAHTNAMENSDISKLNEYEIHFHLSARLKLYKYLDKYLQDYKEILKSTSKSNPNIANALKEALRLDIKLDEVAG